MAEFQEIVSIYKRMCDSCKVCGECHIFQTTRSSCKDYLTKHTEDAEKFLLEWAKEHPVKTNSKKFEEVFGVKPTLEGCQGIQCLHITDNCNECECRHFWESEYKEK